MQVAEVPLSCLELLAGGAVPLAQPPGYDRDDEQGRGIEEHRDELERRRLLRWIEEGRQREHGAGDHDPGVEHAGHPRDGEAPCARQHDARGGDREHVHEGEDGPRATGGRHDCRDERAVEQTDEPGETARLSRRAEQKHRARRRERDDERESENLALARHEAGRDERRKRQQDERDAEPRPGESLERPADGERFHYFIKVTRRKIGRYIATTRPPTTTPRKTIMIGSSKDVSAVTAVSTSSS